MRPVHVETDEAIIILTWWNERPNISIVRTDEEKKRLTVNDKFGDVIPVSALRRFQEALKEISLNQTLMRVIFITLKYYGGGCHTR